MKKKNFVSFSILAIGLLAPIAINTVKADVTSESQNVTSVDSNVKTSQSAEVKTASDSQQGYNDQQISFTAAVTNGNGSQVYNFNDSENGMHESYGKKFGNNSAWHTDIKRVFNNGDTYYRVSTNEWLNSNDVSLREPNATPPAPAYQNPAGWLQIQNTQIQPHGNIGYYLYSGVEGIKVWLLKQHLGVPTSNYQSNIYNGATAQRVRQVQAANGLPVTGITDYDTWCAAGMNPADWNWLDSYIQPLQTNANSTRSDHVEAMINAAYQYIGKPWVSGSASSPVYGVDCSGLVTQAMYASGVDPSPVGSIQHAQPGNEWNCQLLYNDSRIHSVPFGQGLRGDLIFYANPSNGSIWHVAIYLGNGQIIDSWPGSVAVGALNPGNKGTIVKIGRIFY